MSNKSGTSNQVIALPQGGGALQGIGEKFSPDLHTGTGNFTVPIALPPGRNGFQPQLSLVYSTGSGNGLFGLGWNLSIPGVSRQTSKGIPRYEDDRDIFVLSGSEDLVPVEKDPDKTRYQPRTEGLFAKIVHHHDGERNYWEVKSKDGLISRYGTPIAAGQDPAAIANPAVPSQIFAWKLTQTTDPFGNSIEYQYERDEVRVDGAHQWDHLRLDEIRYVDYGDDSGNPRFLARVKFTYANRPDPFSDYRAGFEIRTVKRCSQIEVFIHPDCKPEILTRTYHLRYLDQQGLDAKDLPLNGVSLLSQVWVEGHDQANPDPAQQRELLPPLEFRYSQFEPEGRSFFPVTGPELPPGSLARPEYELADLLGNGLPDILEMSGTVRYWRNLGNGKFDRPRAMKDAPAGLQLADPGVQMIDADGDGRIDLLVTGTGLSGYFPLRFGGFWDRKSFQRYDVAPSFNLEDPEVQLLDLTGDGVTDAIRSGSRMECFFNDPKRGWIETKWVERQSLDKFPDVNFSDPRVKWGDMTGDGLQDILLIHDGNVEYWPNLGYGNWGSRISMKDSPHFRYGYDPRRILVGDVDGDGLADIVYVDDRKVILWINQSGNGWSDPIEIKGTPPVSDMDAVRLVDLLGTGISGVLWSADADGRSRQSMFFLDFTGGVKPYLLNEMDNHMGSLTRVGYAPSIQFYLEDEKRPETRWKTALPFPVQVVAKVEVIDHFSQGKLTTEYRYHHGYWDGGEREFRGFGRVEQRDTEVFEDFHGAGLHPDRPFEPVALKQFSPPLETRTWFHQGPVGDEFGEWYELDYTDEFWAGDPQVLKRPSSVEDVLKGLPRRAKRDAFRVLRGTVLRTELYALDGSDRQDRPYTVTESIYGVREESPPTEEDALPGVRNSEGMRRDRESDRLRIFFPFALAERTTQWERGDEPMTQFKFMGNSEPENDTYTYGYDRYGQVLYQLSIAVPRNRNFLEESPGGTQSPYLSTYSETTYAQRDDDERFIVDRVARTTAYEITNDGTSTVFQLKDAVDKGTASRKIIGQTLSFYDGDAFVGAAFGKIEQYGALVRSLSLVMTEENLQEAYGGKRFPYLNDVGNWTNDYPEEFKSQVPPLAGYVRLEGAEFAKGYFVVAEQRSYDFHEPDGKKRGLVRRMRDPLGRDTAIGYDAHDLLPTIVTDPIGLTTKADYDDRVLQPKVVTDANNNQTEFRFTPLGLLKETWVKGKPENPEGDRTRPSLYMEYGFLAFEDSAVGNRQPIFVRSFQQVHHDTEVDVAQPKRDEVITTVEYSDGFGRLLQTRIQAEEVLFGNSLFGGDVLPLDQNDEGRTRQPVVGQRNRDRENPNVVVSGWQVYDNKGRVVETYEPFYSTGWNYLAPRDEQKGQKVVMVYDPRGQVIRTLNPDGSEQRVLYGIPENLGNPNRFKPTPWEAYTYDANDLAPLSQSPDGASLEIRVPVAHHFTPASIEIDALGRTIKAVERNSSDRDVDWYITQTTYDIRGNVLTIKDALGREAFKHIYDLANRKLWIDSIDAGNRWMVLDALGNPVEQWDSKGVGDSAGQQNRKGALVLYAYDDLNRPTHLWARDGAGQELTLRQRLVYGDGGVREQRASEREANRQRNRLGKLYQHYDEAGMQQFEAYDFKGNLLEKTRRVIRDEQILRVFNNASVNNWQVNAYRVNWGTSASALLEDKPYTTSIDYDALNRVKLMRYPEDVDSARKELRPVYNRAGALEQVFLDGKPYVEWIAYNAKGQRVLIAYGNGVITRYGYDARTFRLGRMRSEKYDYADESLTFRFQGAPLQDFGYEYDLVGNITTIHDRTPESGINGQPDRLDRKFEYDAIYRLRFATGRECNLPPESPPWMDEPRCVDLTSTRAYQERYEYDRVGNMLQLRHEHFDSSGNVQGRNRVFKLVTDEASKPVNNRLDTVTLGQTVYQYTYDKNGNLIQENGARHFEWDYADRMRVFRTQPGNAEPSVHAHYLYDASGQRVKKLVRKQGGQVEITVYIDGVFEYQWIVQGGETRENNTLHVMDNQSRIALARVGNPFPDDTTPAVKYHLGDHLGSSNVVVNQAGALVNQEEYTPYGDTSFGSFGKKRYRFISKERDEESGLYYYGARFYKPYIGRWVSCDPAGPIDGLCLYIYARCNPVILIDQTGRQSVDNITDAGAPTPGGGSTEVAGASAQTPSTGSSTANVNSDSPGKSIPVSASGITGGQPKPPSSLPKVYTRKINPNNPQQANPEIFGMKPTNPDSPISPGEHALNQHNISPAKGSKFLSLSELPEGASTVTGDLKYIEASKLPSDLTIHSNEAIEQDLERLAQEGKVSQERVEAWKSIQKSKEMEVLAEGEIPSSAVTAKRPTVSLFPGGLSVFSGGLQILGATQEENLFLKGAGYGAGGAEIAGGTLYVLGAASYSTKLLTIGGGLATAGGYVGMAVGGATSVRTSIEASKIMNETVTQGEKKGTYPSWFRAIFNAARIGMAFSGM